MTGNTSSLVVIASLMACLATPRMGGSMSSDEKSSAGVSDHPVPIVADRRTGLSGDGERQNSGLRSSAVRATRRIRTRTGSHDSGSLSDTTVHSVTARLALAEILDTGEHAQRSDGTVVITDQVARMQAGGDITGEFTIRFTERVDRAAGIACNAGIVESGGIRLVATGEEVSELIGVTQACVSGTADRPMLVSGYVTLLSRCVAIDLRGSNDVIVDQSNTVSGTWTTCRDAPVQRGSEGQTHATRTDGRTR